MVEKSEPVVTDMVDIDGNPITFTPKLAAPGGGPESAKGGSSESPLDGADASQPLTDGESVAADSPTFVDSVTPFGIEVRYHWAPKRKYELRRPTGVIGPEGQIEGGDWREVPSVTQVLDVLNKPGLPWWGMKVGVEGVLHLHRTYDIPTLMESGDPADIIQLLTEKKLTVNHQRDKAGDRGIVVHDAFETWCNTGIIPDPTMFSEEEQGYVQGLRKFLTDIQPEPVAAEVMVGSLEHEFAGRYDARIYVSRKCEVVYKRTPKRGDHRAVLAPGTLLVDLKTSSGVYPSHELQLAAYEAASIEDGYGPSDGRGIIHVMPDGNYEFFRARASAEDFYAVLSAYTAINKFKRKDR